MNADYFNTPEYFNYLLEHCTEEEDENVGRVGGIRLIHHHLERFGIEPGTRVLEVGCGTGRVLALLKSEFSAEPYGSDICADAIDYIRQNRPDLADRVQLLPPGDLGPYDDASFDAIVIWGSFEFLDPSWALAEIARILRPGGRALLSSVKNRDFLADDEDARAAARAYAEKGIPIQLLEIPSFESTLADMGLVIDKRVVFDRKVDFTKNVYRLDEGGPGSFTEAFYWLLKPR